MNYYDTKIGKIIEEEFDSRAGNIDIYFGHMCFDAKSLGANMNLIGKDAKVVIHTDDESVENKFKEDVNLWIVKKG